MVAVTKPFACAISFCANSHVMSSGRFDGVLSFSGLIKTYRWLEPVEHSRPTAQFHASHHENVALSIHHAGVLSLTFILYQTVHCANKVYLHDMSILFCRHLLFRVFCMYYQHIVACFKHQIGRINAFSSAVINMACLRIFSLLIVCSVTRFLDYFIT